MVTDREPGATPGPDSRAGWSRRARILVEPLFTHRIDLAVLAGISLASAAAALAQPVVVNIIVGDVSNGQGVGPLAWLLPALFLMGALLRSVEEYRLQSMAEDVVLAVRRRLVEHVLRLRIAEFDQHRTGDLVARLTADAGAIRNALVHGLSSALSGTFVFVGALIGMLIVDPLLLVVTVAVITGATLAVLAFAGRVSRASAAVQSLVGRVAAMLTRSLDALRTVRAANATERETTALVAQCEDSHAAGLRLARALALIAPASTVTIQVCAVAIIGVGGLRVAAGQLSVADLATFLLLLFFLLVPLTQAFGSISAVGTAVGAAGRIAEILDLPLENGRPPVQRDPVPRGPGSDDIAVAFDDVHFSYPGAMSDGQMATRPSGPAALCGISFDLPRGTRLAIVGPSGAGKTTVLSLLERFYELDRGVIRVDGVDIRQFDHRELRSRIGYVEQGAPVLAGTLRDNLLLASPHMSDDECEAALDAVGLGALRSRGTYWLDLDVGERGITLSGGERQRLALARALLGRPPILLLDESTSSLDSRSEKFVGRAVSRATTGCTVIIVAHRLATVVDSDAILVLDEGRAVAYGTHDDLLKTTALYRQLAEHQPIASFA